MGIEDAFQDMQDRGLASTGLSVDLAKLTLKQATFCVMLANSADYLQFLDYDIIDWREWGKIHGN